MPFAAHRARLSTALHPSATRETIPGWESARLRVSIAAGGARVKRRHPVAGHHGLVCTLPSRASRLSVSRLSCQPSPGNRDSVVALLPHSLHLPAARRTWGVFPEPLPRGGSGSGRSGPPRPRTARLSVPLECRIVTPGRSRLASEASIPFRPSGVKVASRS